MKRILFAATLAAVATLSPAGTALAQAPESYTPQQAFASPTVTVGGRTAPRLCELGAMDTMPDQPGVAEAQVSRLACSQQNVPPLRLRRARYARINLQAPADRVLAGWYQDGALRPLNPVQTGAQQWNVTPPPTSGRLFLRVIFEINFTVPPYEFRIDWKLSIRRTAGRQAPSPTVAESVVPIDDTPPPPMAGPPVTPGTTFQDQG